MSHPNPRGSRSRVGNGQGRQSGFGVTREAGGSVPAQARRLWRLRRVPFLAASRVVTAVGEEPPGREVRAAQSHRIPGPEPPPASAASAIRPPGAVAAGRGFQDARPGSEHRSPLGKPPRGGRSRRARPSRRSGTRATSPQTPARFPAFMPHSFYEISRGVWASVAHRGLKPYCNLRIQQNKENTYKLGLKRAHTRSQNVFPNNFPSTLSGALDVNTRFRGARGTLSLSLERVSSIHARAREVHVFFLVCFPQVFSAWKPCALGAGFGRLPAVAGLAGRHGSSPGSSPRPRRGRHTRPCCGDPRPVFKDGLTHARATPWFASSHFYALRPGHHGARLSGL